MVRDWMTDGVRPLVYMNPYLGNMDTKKSMLTTEAGPELSMSNLNMFDNFVHAA